MLDEAEIPICPRGHPALLAPGAQRGNEPATGRTAWFGRVPDPPRRL